MRFSTVICALLFLPAAGLSAQAASSSADAPHVHVQLVVPEDQIYPAGNNAAGLYFKLEPGWHVYWKNAGDSGEPPHIRWTLPEGVTASEMQFPAPKRLPLGPLMDFGYEDEVLFPLQFQVAGTVKQGKAILHAHVDWLVCREVCIPGKAELEVKDEMLPAAPPAIVGSAVEAELIHRLARTLPQPLPAGFKAVFQPSQDGFRLGVETGKRERAAVFFPADENVLDNPSAQKVTPTAKGLVLDLKKDANLAANPAQLKGVLELAGGRSYELAALPGTVKVGWFGVELLQVVGLAFLGGLLLNLMPCVFPVLFLKGLALVNSGNKERHAMRAHGFVYAAGILVSFWVLVGALLGLRAAGATLGWGFQFQSPVFLALMAGLLFFMGLSLAGLFEIGLTLTSAGGSLAAKEGYTGSFFTGVLAVVVATPCTAPFMGAAIGYALAQTAGVTFAVFTALALGLAAPYCALTLQPAWTRWLPRPGAWMDVLRKAISVPIFATVIWLAWVLEGGYGIGLLGALLASFVLLAIAGWFLGRWPAQRWATVVAGVIVLAAIALSVLAPGKLAAAPESQKAGPQAQGQWEPWSAEAVSRYQAEGRPVFVDFTASWCLSCQVNERVALGQPSVQKAFKAGNVALLKADWTRHDEAITQALTALGRSGVPAYALYAPGQSEPVMLPEVLTPGIVTDAVGKLAH
ncbi:MAG: protein-disulfide reductase DsbD family protein [Terracidiphilus sp.]|nr:protein-disulfide reductase DsbD family protein [Terracidiphilus sp.]